MSEVSIDSEKREFMKQYVLNRALGQPGSLSGENAAISAHNAWIEIKKLTETKK